MRLIAGFVRDERRSVSLAGDAWQQFLSGLFNSRQQFVAIQQNMNWRNKAICHFMWSISETE